MAPAAPQAPQTQAPDEDLAPQGPQPTAPLAVDARDLRVTAGRGRVFGPVDLAVPFGALTVVRGPQGHGRTSLLLTLAGRMTPDATSSLSVLAHELPAGRRAVQRRAALAGFVGIDDLDDSVTVGAHVRERLAWLSPWYVRAPRPDQRTVDATLWRAFGSRAVPDAGTVAWHLDEVDTLLLRVALAMAQRPRLLLVDDVDQVHDAARRRIVWDRLAAIAARGTTVVASTAAWEPETAETLAVLPHVVTTAQD
jgi:ABC-type multidrug transport system ATPase subunit